VRTNLHPGPCAKCGASVPAQAGTLQGPPWRVWCAGCLPRPAEQPAVVRVQLVAGDRAAFAPTGYLGGERFGAYRAALGPDARFEPTTKTNQLRLTMVAAAVSRLRDSGFLLDVDPDIAATMQARVAAAGTDRVAATERAQVVDAALRERGLALFPFQAVGVEWLAPLRGAVLADDMGLGKTIQALTAIPAGAPAVVVGPSVAKGVWEAECRRWRPDLEPVVLSGRGSFRWPDMGELVITNYDVLPTPEQLAQLSLPVTGTVLIADEAHALKGDPRKVKRAAAWDAMAQGARDAGGRTWLLTGTPLLNRPQELWRMLAAADVAEECFGKWWTFAQVMGGVRGRYGYDWFPDRIDRDEVARRLQRGMLRRMKAEVLSDLPAKTRRDVSVNGLDRETRALCDSALRALEEQGIDWDEEAELAEETRCGGTAFEQMSAARRALAIAKIPHMMALVEEHEEAEVPLVVFSAHRAPVEALAARPGWAVITGETSAEERTEIARQFQAGELRGVGLTIRAGGVAVTLTRASSLLVVDQDWTPALNLQAEDRVHRIGQRSAVTITRLVADHALDRRVAELLGAKLALMEASVDAARTRGSQRPTPAQVVEEVVTDLGVDTARCRMLAAEQAELEARLAQLAAEAEAAERAVAELEPERRAQAKARRSAERRGVKVGEGGGVAPRRGPRTARECWAAQALTALAGMDPDRAYARNDVGFNKVDGGVGHALAERLRGGLSSVEWGLAQAVCAKYWRQVGRMPEREADEQEVQSS